MRILERIITTALFLLALYFAFNMFGPSIRDRFVSQLGGAVIHSSSITDLRIMAIIVPGLLFTGLLLWGYLKQKI